MSLGEANTMDFAALGLDAAVSLKLLYNSFIKGGEVTNAVDGTRRETTIPVTLSSIENLSTSVAPSTKAAGSLVVNVLTNAAFQDAYPDSLFHSIAGTTGMYVRAKDAAGYVALTAEDQIPNTQFAETDINVYEWLVAQGGDLAAIAVSLRDMKVAYQLLDSGIYTSMMAQSDPTKLNIFPPRAQHAVHDLILKTTVAPIKPKIVNDPTDYDSASQESAFNSNDKLSYFARTLDPVTQDIFAVRRVILATYLMTQARLFSRMYFALRNPTGVTNVYIDTSANALIAGKLAHYFYSRLIALNTSYESSRLEMDGAVASTSTINRTMQDNVAIYTDNTNALSSINDDMGYKRRALANEIVRVKSESSDASYSKRLVVAAIILAATLLLVLFAVFVMPVDVQVRIKVASMVVAMALVVVAVLVFLQKRNIHEGFVVVTSGGLNVAFDASLSTTAAADINKLASMMDLVFTESLRNYYRYTVEITLLLKNNRLYNELNYNTSKERNWFENSQYQLNKNVNDSRTAQRLYDRKTKISTALLRFVLQLLVIVAFVVLGVAAVQDAVPILVNVIYVIGGILFVMAVFYLFGDVLRRTYIDADRLYWGTPSAVKDL